MRGWPTPLLWGLSCLWVTACGSLGPKADPSRFFILTPAPQLQHSSPRCSPTSTTLAVGIGPIHLPSYLDRQELVSRVTANRLDVAGCRARSGTEPGDGGHVLRTAPPPALLAATDAEGRQGGAIADEGPSRLAQSMGVRPVSCQPAFR